LATSVGRLFDFVIGLFAARAAEPPAAAPAPAELPAMFVRAAEPPPAAPTPAEPPPAASGPAVTPTMSAFIARIRQDAALRARFGRSPDAVLREFGIDPTPFSLLGRLNDAQIQELVNDWTAGVIPTQGPYGGQQSAPVLAQVSNPVYGPPPSLRRP
jgi:hypothetical protein